MAVIQLTKGIITTIDDELFSELNKFSWYAAGLDYRPARRLTIEEHTGRPLIYMYHQILNIRPWCTDKVVDHIDGDVLNNKRDNLRLVTQQENMRNMKKRKEGRIGIAYCKTYDKFKAYVDIFEGARKRRVNVGTFPTFESARIARDMKLLELGL